MVFTSVDRSNLRSDVNGIRTNGVVGLVTSNKGAGVGVAGSDVLRPASILALWFLLACVVLLGVHWLISASKKMSQWVSVHLRCKGKMSIGTIGNKLNVPIGEPGGFRWWNLKQNKNMLGEHAGGI